MKKTFTKISIYCSLFILLAGAAKAQDSTKEFKAGGKLWGYAFGDLAYKGSGDNTGRGGGNQYTGVPTNANEFQFRRIYLGYNYDISKHFSAEFLLAAEDDFNANFPTGPLNAKQTGTGDVLSDGKFTPYVKLANLRWKNIWKNSDLVIGQSPTPTFAQGAALKENTRNAQTSEEVWGYRSIERTITDIRRTSSYDMGLQLQGWFDDKGNFGYDAFAANGNGAKPATNAFKWFYGNIYAKFMDKKLIIDLYQDYYKMNWGQWIQGYKIPGESPNGPWYHDRNMTKLFVAYTVPKLTVGVEYYMNTLMGDVTVTGKDGNTYYRNTVATGLSIFVKGRITKDKLGFFARYDMYDPTSKLSDIVSNPNTAKYAAVTGTYDPTTKEQFATFGIDYTPIKNVHIMPNVWLNTYDCALSATGSNSIGTKYSAMNGGVTGEKGTDAVYRLTFYYVYGK